MNKYLYFICIFLLGLTFIAAQNDLDDSKTIIFRDLDKIESLYFKNLSSRDKQEALSLTNEIRELLISCNNYNILSEDGFELLYQNVENEITEFSKTEALIESIGTAKIFCRQLEKLISLYSSDLMKEKLIQSISDNILDPVNIGVVLQHINSAIIRDNLTEYFNN